MKTKTWLALISVILVSVLAFSACRAQEPVQENPTPTAEKTASPTSTDPTAVTEQAVFSDADARQLLYDLTDSPHPEEAVDAIVSAGDNRFIAAFIELMRANRIGLNNGAGNRAHIAALETLSGESFGSDWFAWVEWYGTTDLQPPPGFTGWKGQLLSGIDPRFGDFLQDGHASTIRVEEIQWGGVLVDGIPALINASMIPAGEAGYLEEEEPVFGISINGDHRAYPLRILDWHEMANDVVGGVPVSLAYCTLCGAGIAFDGRASNGESYTFGSSGFLFRSNKLMYDHQTRTLWNQLTGEPVLGELVGQDVRLELLPIVLTSWESWKSQHPDTVVLSLETGYNRPYQPGAAYGNYFSEDDTMFPVWQRSSLLETKDRVYALQVEHIPKAYPLDILLDEQVVNDTIGSTNVVLVAARDEVVVQNSRAFYSAGGEVRAYVRGEKVFTPGPTPDTVLDAEGQVWQVTEEALVGPAGELATRINGHLAYWFGWYAFFPKTLLYGVE